MRHSACAGPDSNASPVQGVCVSTIAPPLRDAAAECHPLPQRHNAAEQQNQNKTLFSDIAMDAFRGAT